MKRQEFVYGQYYDVVDLDEKGRCCGRKPVVYKKPYFHTFCCRCHRSHNQDGKQINNWAWSVGSDKALRNNVVY